MPYCHVNRSRHKLEFGPLYLYNLYMKSAYLDAFSGLSGDMIAGAMLDAGAGFDELRDGARIAAA